MKNTYTITERTVSRNLFDATKTHTSGHWVTDEQGHRRFLSPADKLQGKLFRDEPLTDVEKLALMLEAGLSNTCVEATSIELLKTVTFRRMARG